MRVAEPRRRRAAHEIVERLVGENTDLRIEQCHVEVLALAGALAVIERCLDTDGAIEPGEDIGEGHADLHGFRTGLAIGLARDRHDAAHALDHEVIAGALCVRPGLAEAGQRAVDEARVDGFETFIIEAVFLEAADLEVLQHDVGLGGELAYQLLTFWLGHVDFHRPLAAVGREEIGGVALAAVGIGDEGRAPAARVVTFARPFHLDHLRAEIGEDLRGPWPGEHAAQVEDAKTGKWTWHDGSVRIDKCEPD